METIKHTSSQVNTNSQKVFLSWNGEMITLQEFKQIPETYLMRNEDDIMGFAEYPKADITDKNKYLIIERSKELVKAPYRYKPEWHDYNDIEWWAKQPIWKPDELHKMQFHLWDYILKQRHQKLYITSGRRRV